MHPALAEAHQRAWEEREKRNEIRNAELQLTFAQVMGTKKKNRTPLTLSDFLPAWAKPKKTKSSGEESEAKLKAYFMSRATTGKPKN